jgi:hypothetical protein
VRDGTRVGFTNIFRCRNSSILHKNVLGTVPVSATYKSISKNVF